MALFSDNVFVEEQTVSGKKRKGEVVENLRISIRFLSNSWLCDKLYIFYRLCQSRQLGLFYSSMNGLFDKSVGILNREYAIQSIYLRT